MRLLAVLLLTAMLVAPVAAQSAPVPPQLLGPSFLASSVQAGNFDAAFDVTVAMPGMPVLRNQTAEARFDAVVCNAQGKAKGGAQASGSGLSTLEPGVCTMFSNFGQLELTTMEAGGEWTAKVYLRARR
jgi:hypothetical protein